MTIDVRSFSNDEIGEINNYVLNQIPQSQLPQLFMLTENPSKKALIYITVVRILSGVRDFIEEGPTKDKLGQLVEQEKELYSQIYKLYIELEEEGVEYGSENIKMQLIDTILQNNHQINKFCNSFLVFAEKQELLNTDSVSGINLEKPEGQDMMNKIINSLK